MKIIIGCLIVLSAFFSTVAHALIAPVVIDIGTVYTSPGSGWYCGVTNDQLPGGLTQTGSFTTTGQLTFGTNGYSVSTGPGSTTVCVQISWNLSTYGSFAGQESVSFQGYTFRILASGSYQYGTWSGQILPKYEILGVDYAPPGSSSFVTYSASFSRGGSTSISKSLKNQVSVTVSESQKFDIGILSSHLSFSITGLYAQTGESTRGDSWSITTTGSDTIPGPAASVVGINHDYDIVWIWLNPAVELTLTGPASIQWNGYSYNPADPVNEMDVTYLYVYELKNPALIPPNVVSRMARTWDQSGVGGLTAADYAAILASDPFAVDPSYNPNTDTTGRYSPEGTQTINYRPAGPGAQAITEQREVTSTTGSSSGSSKEITRSVSATINDSLSGGIFKAKLGLELDITDTLTTTTKKSSTSFDDTGQTAKLSITGPLDSDHYTGPTAIQVWRDNVYGSFMFYGVL
jgi:hypothetical protein